LTVTVTWPQGGGEFITDAGRKKKERTLGSVGRYLFAAIKNNYTEGQCADLDFH